MNRGQLTYYVMMPMLREIPKGYSTPAIIGITMIIAHESNNLHYIKQTGNGPALGPIQMEPATHASTWQNGDSIWDNALICGIITPGDFAAGRHPPATRLLYDLRYNVFMARQRLFMKPKALPTDLVELSAYLKRHWNTVMGKANKMSYLNAYRNWK